MRRDFAPSPGCGRILARCRHRQLEGRHDRVNGGSRGAGTGTAARAGSDGWTLETGSGSMSPRTAIDVLNDVRTKVATGELADYEPVPLGLMPLDRMLGGGLRPGELMLIGGAQGTGKTTLALQMARNIAASGQAYVLYVCFEHDDADMLNRLIAMESVLPHLPNTKPSTGAVKITDVRAEVIRSWARSGDNDQVDLAANPKLRPAIERIARYGNNLYMLRGSQTASTVENLRELIEIHRRKSGERRMVLFVDYLQKVPQLPEPPSESEKVTFVVNGLKDIALTEKVPTIEIVAKVNIEFNPYQAQRFRDWIVASIEKNRSGADNIDIEYQKHFDYSCFDPTGRPVQEKLIEERLY